MENIIFKDLDLEQDTNIKLTYLQWQRIGMQVKKGEKSSNKTKNGKALFTQEQVKDKFTSRYEIDREEDAEFAAAYGLDIKGG